jgi:hypothetical protein
MTTGPSRDLTRALTEYAAQIPVPVSADFRAANSPPPLTDP